MNANGFLDQRPSHKASLGLVLLLHAGVISAVALIKGNEWIRDVDRPIVADFETPPVPPPPPPPPPSPQPETPRPQTSQVYTPDPITPVPPLPNSIIGSRDVAPTPPIDAVPGPVLPPGPVGPQIADATPVRPTPPPTPVRIDSQFAAGAQLQPPYPAEEQRREREGVVRVRVTIGADGRVQSTEQVSATSDAFWRETQRWAVNRWRFRPATVDGRPVASTKVVTIQFRLGA